MIWTLPKQALKQSEDAFVHLFFLSGPDPGEQHDLRDPPQGPLPADQTAAPLPVQEHAQGHATQHAQESAGAAHPREPDQQDQEGLLRGHGPRHRHGYETSKHLS